jgi:predicted secreted protein
MKVTVELTGCPSTGYDWEPDRKPDATDYVSRGPTEDDDGEPLFGGQAFTKFVFNNVEPGTDLTFNYRRPWETDAEPREIVRVRVE